MSISIDSTSKSEGILEAVAAKPRDMIENRFAGVVIKDDFLLFVSC